MSKVTIVSADGHAAMPEELWPEYVEKKYHQYLSDCHEDGERFINFQKPLVSFSDDALALMDPDHVLRSGRWQGVWDLDLRLAEMDREGIAAEFVIPGDQRVPMLFSSFFRELPEDLLRAGNQAYHRWAYDTFIPGKERLFVVGDAAVAGDMDFMLGELDWLSEHGFVATGIPGRVVREDFPPLYDPFFDPFWSKCEDLGLAVVMHAGYGTHANEYGRTYEKVIQNMEAAGRTNLLEEFMVHAKDFFALNLKPRQAMWQMMLGGVFDRHPRLKLLLVELRADWLPGTLAHLDATYLRARDQVPAKKLPSEYFRRNCLAGVSFMHKAEVQYRYEIGIESMNFGRDYPHSEGTWPNTDVWLADCFAGVPEDELRLLLGGNLIRTLGLDPKPLDAIAERIGPPVQAINGGSKADPELLEVFQSRGGYLQPPEKPDPAALDQLLLDDLAAVSRQG
ncbi:MAG TPA: amidohydrolase family protein [Amycolatopsis sp.]|uniref:amidohydrolase family protein n=1 Tax=Amycolatopsis sp. TaxID=37632 RepID=UPI002B499B54|nr:amidohydrolase family protein [Amycolatopsis sp.]HKS46984.1 amidohydrolase family protein [Amycolatopsis sp.]